MKWWIVLLAIVGLFDASYLSYEHFSNKLPPCTVNTFSWLDCGTVLRSEYAYLLGVPLAVWGMVHYGFLILWLGINKSWSKRLAVGQSLIGLIMSGYFVYLQLGVLGVVCGYCMVSALTSTILFLSIWYVFDKERKWWFIKVFGILYQKIVKPLLFLADPEDVHVNMVKFGETAFQIPGVSALTKMLFRPRELPLEIGLAAGFDYEGRLTKVLPAWGFTFQTIGTITNLPWEGNAKPRLGRLPKSKSLLVNKGFRNPGADEIIKKLSGKRFENRVGISIGDAKGEIDNILSAFKKFQVAEMNHSYYELNISCPNLEGAKSLYEISRLRNLLTRLDNLKINRPIYIKMPIEKSDKEFLELLKEISKHKISGIVVGNLQKNRQDPSLDLSEVSRAGKGNFSGKPTERRSIELIVLTRKNFKNKFEIVGCGGVFNAHDAEAKLAAGADKIQLITGMIFQGPQIVADIQLTVS